MLGGDFTVADGAVLDFGGGASFTITGSYTGSGDGQVRFDSGTLTPRVGGATFNFPQGFFNWSGNSNSTAVQYPAAYSGHKEFSKLCDCGTMRWTGRRNEW